MQAPTDNLYKFLAISGLVCSLFFYFDYTKRKDELLALQNTQRMATAVLKVKMDAAKEKQKSLKEDLDVMLGRDHTLEEALEIRTQWERDQPELKELFLLYAKWDASNNMLDESRERLEDIWDSYKKLGVSSFVLFVFGLCLWYFKTQRYLDLKEIPADKLVQTKLKHRLPRRK